MLHARLHTHVGFVGRGEIRQFEVGDVVELRLQVLEEKRILQGGEVARNCLDARVLLVLHVLFGSDNETGVVPEANHGALELGVETEGELLTNAHRGVGFGRGAGAEEEAVVL